MAGRLALVLVEASGGDTGRVEDGAHKVVTGDQRTGVPSRRRADRRAGRGPLGATLRTRHARLGRCDRRQRRGDRSDGRGVLHPSPLPSPSRTATISTSDPRSTSTSSTCCWWPTGPKPRSRASRPGCTSSTWSPGRTSWSPSTRSHQSTRQRSPSASKPTLSSPTTAPGFCSMSCSTS
jgi:hypothetical protein